MSFVDLGWTPAQCIRLLDTKTERVIKCRYSNAKRPKDISIILSTNLVPPEVLENDPNWLAAQQIVKEEHRQPSEWIFPRGSNAEQDIAISRRYRVEGPVERMLATPTSSWGRFVKEAMKKKEAANEDNASDTDTTVSRASTMCKQLVQAARTHRGMAPKPEVAVTSSFF